MKPITDASNKILKTLQTLSDKLRPCRQTLATMTNIFSLVDLSIFVLYGNSQKDKSVDENLTSLEQMVGKFGQQIMYERSILPTALGFTNQSTAQCQTH